MDRNDRLDTAPDGEGAKSRNQGCLLLQFALIGSGRVSNTSEDMQTAARGIFEEVIDAARTTGCSIGSPLEAALFSAGTVYALFDWLDAVCSTAGVDVVDEIFARPKPQYLQ